MTVLCAGTVKARRTHPLLIRHMDQYTQGSRSHWPTLLSISIYTREDVRVLIFVTNDTLRIFKSVYPAHECRSGIHEDLNSLLAREKTWNMISEATAVELRLVH